MKLNNGKDLLRANALLVFSSAVMFSHELELPKPDRNQKHLRSDLMCSLTQREHLKAFQNYISMGAVATSRLELFISGRYR